MVRRKPRKSFDLLSAYSYYVPGGGGVCMLLLMMFIGAVLGNIVVLLLGLFSMDFAQTYGMLISYPLMFIPAMLYASAQSRRNEMFETGYALDNNNFGRLGGFSSALAVSIATLALAFIMDSVNMILPPMPDYIKAIFEKLTEGPLWVTFISVSIFAPFFEEWLCRGMILRGLLQKMKPFWAITVSALVFALIHLNPWQGLPAFALGLLFGYVPETQHADALREQHLLDNPQPGGPFQGCRILLRCTEHHQLHHPDGRLHSDDRLLHLPYARLHQPPPGTAQCLQASRG